MSKLVKSISVVIFLSAPYIAKAQRIFQNPVGGEGERPNLPIGTLILRGVQWFMPILGILSFVFIIIGGFQVALAAGNDEKIAQGKKTLLFALLGLIVAFLGFIFVPVILEGFLTMD